MEKRVLVLEKTVENYGRRLTDHEDKIQLVLDWKNSIQESTEVNRRMVEVGEGILAALSWVGIGARWIMSIGGALTAVWLFVKHLGGLVK